MRDLIITIVLLTALISIGTGDEDSYKLIENIKPGNTVIDLGNGYSASFNLDDSISKYNISTYDISVLDPVTPDWGGEPYFTNYQFFIGSTTSEELAQINILISVFDTPISRKKPIYDDSTSEGIRWVETPRIIDNSIGSNLIKYYNDEEVAASAQYFPGAIKTLGTTIESRSTVTIELRNYEEGISKEYPIFESIINSIHISGPAI